MDNLHAMLRSFGLDPRWTWERLQKGELQEVLALLEKEESRISLRQRELQDLRETLIARREERCSSQDEEELSDEDMELLSAAGEERRVDP